MKRLTWLAILGTFAFYAAAVLVFGFEGAVAYTVQFVRVTIAVAVLVFYLPLLPSIFNEVPPPRRDYLLAGIILTWLSGFSFSTFNEFGRVTGADTNIFTSPVAGFFSLLLVVGGFFHMVAPATGGNRQRLIAVGAGLAVAAGVVIIAPYFR